MNSEKSAKDEQWLIDYNRYQQELSEAELLILENVKKYIIANLNCRTLVQSFDKLDGSYLVRPCGNIETLLNTIKKFIGI